MERSHSGRVQLFTKQSSASNGPWVRIPLSPQLDNKNPFRVPYPISNIYNSTLICYTFRVSLLDFLFPKRCIQCKKIGSYICPQCFSYITFADSMVCAMCQKQAIDGITHPRCRTRYSIDGVFPSIVYKGVVKKMVYSFKYPPYLTDLQSQLGDLFYEGIIQKERFFKLLDTPSVLVPIPLHKKKFRKRGYNQSFLLANGLAEQFGMPVFDVLQRIKETKTQVGLNKELRQENIRGAFAIDPKFQQIMQSYDNIFLVDDVVTSGATLREAANVLKRAGVKHVWGLTLAHGE